MTSETFHAKYVELMSKHYTIQCKCGQCGRKQAIRISELAAGQDHCRITRLGQLPCNGTVEYLSEDREEAISNAISLIGYLNLINAVGDETPLAILLDTVVDDVGCWSERGATPQEMGWVGQNGLP